MLPVSHSAFLLLESEPFFFAIPRYADSPLNLLFRYQFLHGDFLDFSILNQL